MSRSTQLARQRARQIREERERSQLRRRRLIMAGSAVGVIVLALAMLVVVRLARSDTPAASSPTDTAALTARLGTVSPQLLDQVGRGHTETLPTRLTGQPALTADGKPLVLYVGAEYCPFCAGQRWPLIIALSRFGQFSGLVAARSATDDVYPGTATWSFHGSSYRSDYLSFEAVELATSERRGNSYVPLEKLTEAQSRLLATYDAPPYVPDQSAGAVPFVDFGNRYLMAGSAVNPGLMAGLDQAAIMAALDDPDSDIGQAVLGSANAFTAVLCDLTAGKPATVCSASGVATFSAVIHGES